MKLVLEDEEICKDPVEFNLRFGFKCFMNLGTALGLNTFKEVADKFAGFGSGEIKLDQLDLIEKLVIAAAQAHPKYDDMDVAIYDFPIIDTMLVKPELLEQLVKEFVASFPQQGKPKPQKAASRTRAAKA
jgi:hypothetical protein